jgi:hypothetical protein
MTIIEEKTVNEGEKEEEERTHSDVKKVSKGSLEPTQEYMFKLDVTAEANRVTKKKSKEVEIDEAKGNDGNEIDIEDAEEILP